MLFNESFRKAASSKLVFGCLQAPLGPMGLPMQQFPASYDSVGRTAAGGPQLWMERYDAG